MKHSASKLLLTALSGVLLLTGCATNSATGRNQFVAFLPESQEIDLGRELHPQILKKYGGAYQDEELSAYVERIGQELARKSERADLQWKFTVLDTPLVNAFAVPGGYIYITRGLLAILQSEAELAAVLGHEIGHVTAKHGAEGQSRATIAGIFTAGVGLATGNNDYARAASMLSQITLHSYSREQEHEADRLGIRYSSRLGYHPDSMHDALVSLQQGSALTAYLKGEAYSEEPDFMASHPMTSDRINQTRALAVNEIRAEPARIDGMSEYDNMINGMVFGDSERHGYFRDGLFIHPDLSFRFRVPDDFEGTNTPSQLILKNDRGDAAVIIDLVKSPRDGAEGYLYDVVNDLDRPGRIQTARIAGRAAARVISDGKLNNKDATIETVVIEWSDTQLMRFRYATENIVYSRYLDDFEDLLVSLRKLSRAETQRYRPYRIEIRRARPGDTVSSLASRLPFEDDKMPRFVTLNGWSDNHRLQSGDSYRTITK